MHFLDTNVLMYSISPDPAEARKRDRAIALLDDDAGAISVQVLQEFYTQVTRLTRPRPISCDDAEALIERWMRFPVQPMTLQVFKSALQFQKRYGFLYWDCAILAAARALACRRVYTEGMSHGQIVEGMTVVNPFHDC